MANLEQIVSRKAENDTKWKEAQQAERENTTAMQDAGITEITSNPEAYARYLEMQGDNPSYSAGNIALVMFGNPEATVFGTRDRWKTLNRSVMDSEKNNGVKIFARSPMGRGYTLADAYDIKQTQGRDISRITLQNDSTQTCLMRIYPLSPRALRTMAARWNWQMCSGRSRTVFIMPRLPTQERYPANMLPAILSRRIIPVR